MADGLQIFVGGLGRSGTTILTEMIGKHRDIFAMEWETRFIVDPAGVGELIDSLSDNWGGPTTGGMKLQAFRELMTVHLVDPSSAPYEGYCVYDYFDREAYDALVNSFLSSLIVTEWGAWGLSKGQSFTLRSRAGEQEVELKLSMAPPNRILPRYFKRQEITELAARFVGDLFGAEARRRGKRHWCEKTPHNILSPYPRLLFPQCKVVHILRDPRDVIASIASGEHEWGTKTVADAIRWTAEFYRRWLDLAAAYQSDPNYFCIRFEGLVERPERTLRDLCRFLGVEYDPAMCGVELNRPHIGRHAGVFGEEDWELFRREVAPLAARAGFEDVL